MVNDFGVLYMKYNILSDMKEAVTDYSRLWKAMRKSTEPVASVWVLFLTLLLPFGLPKFIVWMISSKPTLFYSNVNGMKNMLSINNTKITGQFFFLQVLGLVSSCVGISTVGDKMSVSVHCDEVGMDPDEFLEIFTQKYNDAIKNNTAAVVH